MRPIHVIVTGGTFDKTYNKSTGLLDHSASSVESILEKTQCGIFYNISTLFLKDSNDITDSERNQIKQLSHFVSEESIIVVHGTDTMVKTATLLSDIPNKTIITVGAFIPHSVIDSDAEFNLGVAIAYSQFLDHGSYVAMNGIAFPHDKVKKDYETQTFVRCNPK